MRSRRDDARAEHHVRQLCREVERTLGCAFPAAADPVVRALLVVAVEPAPDAARLLVSVAPSTGLEAGVEEIHAHLDRVRGFLRDEIAAAIVRKRTPDLAFRVVLPTEN